MPPRCNIEKTKSYAALDEIRAAIQPSISDSTQADVAPRWTGLGMLDLMLCRTRSLPSPEGWDLL